MVRLIFLVLVLTTSLSCYKSNDNIENMIREKFWNNGKTIPHEILKDFQGHMIDNTQVILRTSKSYYPNEDEISCAYIKVLGPFVTLYMQYGKDTPVKKVNVYNVFENDGSLYVKDRNESRVYLYTNKRGVNALYHRIETDKPGLIRGLIAGFPGEYEEDAVSKAVEDLRSVKIEMSNKTFDVSCLPKNSQNV